MKQIIVGIALLLGCFSFGQEAHLNITIAGIQSGKGKIMYTVFSDKSGFPSDVDKAIEKGLATIKNGEAEIGLDLPHGEYAVMVFHDEDDDNELRTNWFGLPKEGVGNSNNHKGIPSFKKSVFKLSEDKTIKINLFYM
ncbi:DUF2141 domain-containing protein [Maribacter polysiphoniae]|uniref:DUF2141 domain-containing protein n=1 Tax=Maribacter polysiphoniae TaxID=429344 RepID=A0A316E0G0_9FLAO|nr:DUF2141 domain-containing protein [Maribacter polysiphoniae]MBD1260928.1 DUF2141 domain-containing protein [Maribacter polysiphoniae]PWK23934.1 uncharacterized protein (DUF2141 family) [Maribacter polysiphoniae]